MTSRGQQIHCGGSFFDREELAGLPPRSRKDPLRTKAGQAKDDFLLFHSYAGKTPGGAQGWLCKRTDGVLDSSLS